MKGCYLLPFCLITCSTVFAAATTTPPPAAVSATESQIESKQIASATSSNTPQTSTGNFAAGSGYFEIIGGIGGGTMAVGKSRLGVSAAESDWISQTKYNWQSPFAQLGVGYVYSLSDMQRGYADTLIWLPSVEGMFNIDYFNLTAHGDVYRFNNFNLNTSTFSLPVKTTSFTLDALLTLAAYKHASVFVLVGAGEAWSRISYSDSPDGNNPAARPALNINSRTQSNMVYEWGAGVAYSFNSRVALSLEYLYTHIGNIRTANTGSLGGVVDTQINGASFALRTQAGFLDLRVALN